MTLEQIYQEITNKIFRPIYFLHGKESYYNDELSDFIAGNVLTEAEKSFNFSVIYGKDTDPGQIVTLARRFPMMANYQVIIVKEAQQVKNLLGEEASKSSKPNPLQVYAENPLKSTILVFEYKYNDADGRRKILKTIEKTGAVYQSKVLYENELPDWINRYLKKRNFKITPNGVQLIIEYTGPSLSKLANELNKLILSLEGKKNEIDISDVEHHTGMNKEFTYFELSKAIGEKDVKKANKIINYFGNTAKDESFPLIAILFNYFSKILSYHYAKEKSPDELAALLGINKFFLREYQVAAKNYPPAKTTEIIHFLRVYDLKLKGVDTAPATSSHDLLRELVYKILH